MSTFDKGFYNGMRCEEIAPLLVFYVCDEVSEQERKHVEAHLASCADCTKQLAEERIVLGPWIAVLEICAARAANEQRVPCEHAIRH